VEWNRDTPWRQGHLLNDDAIEALDLRHPTNPEQTVVVVVTHDCDLSQDPKGEPSVELVVGTIAAKDGNYTHGKTARRLHIHYGGEAACWVELEATAKVAIDKWALNAFAPRSDATLDPGGRAILQSWLASRYRRSAFPDEFERRLLRETKLAEKIQKAVKPYGELISGIFFDVDEGVEVVRDGPDDTYKLDIIILHVAEPDFDVAEKAARAVADAIEKAFTDRLFDEATGWRYIELSSCEPIAETALDYQTFKQMKKWRLEHMSLAAEPQQPPLTE
jgi:hypothetical protein